METIRIHTIEQTPLVDKLRVRVSNLFAQSQILLGAKV